MGVLPFSKRLVMDVFPVRWPWRSLSWQSLSILQAAPCSLQPALPLSSLQSSCILEAHLLGSFIVCK